MRQLRAAGQLLLDILLPSFCGLCGPSVAPGQLPHLCDSCADALELETGEVQCVVCAEVLERHFSVGDRCLPCRVLRPSYLHASAMGPYSGVLRRMLVDCKFQRRPYLMAPLALLLSAEQHRLVRARPELSVDLIVPVPSDPERQRRRGFNTPEVLARRLPAALQAEMPRGVCRRRAGTRAQTEGSRSARTRLSAKTFEVIGPIWGRRCLVVDDIFTTGSTLRAITRALLEAGAFSVRVCVAARTSRPGRALPSSAP